MKVSITDLNYSNIDIANPIKLVMQKKIYEPYTSAGVVFPTTQRIDALILNLYDDNNNQLFTGYTDKVYTYMDDDGKYMEVTARSRGALLTDNDAIPREFPYNTFIMDYFQTYIQNKYGINYKEALNASTVLKTEIYKGDSEWDALGTIVWFAYGCAPDVNEDGLVVFNPNFINTTHTFSNSAEGGIKFSYLSYNDDRYKRYSQMWGISEVSGQYMLMASDQTETAQMINRRKLINFPDTKEVANMQLCDYELKQNNADTRFYTIRVPGYKNFLTWEKAAINDTMFGNNSNLFLTSVKYVMDMNGEYTEVELRPTSSKYSSM
ncbi:MAG TPA: hypothetical protein H9675_02735 [Firmicutes bacterium]|nr:hypothetical protein [Bacillota bacterium]